MSQQPEPRDQPCAPLRVPLNLTLTVVQSYRLWNVTVWITRVSERKVIIKSSYTASAATGLMFNDHQLLETYKEHVVVGSRLLIQTGEVELFTGYSRFKRAGIWKLSKEIMRSCQAGYEIVCPVAPV